MPSDTNIYLETYRALLEQLENLANPANVPSEYPIQIETILPHVTDPVKLDESHLPAVAYAYGRTVPNPAVTNTVGLQGETFSIELYITINKTETEDLIVRSTKMQSAIKIVAAALKNAASTDDGTVKDCRLASVLPFREILSDREFLKFEVAFDIASRK